MTVVSPDVRLILAGQLEVERENLAHVQHLLGLDMIDQALRQAVAVRFAELFARRREGVDAVDALLHDDSAGIGDVHRLFRRVREENARLVKECLAFLQGALARSAGVDGGVCALADHLLRELVARTEISWARLTIPAEAEFVDLTAHIIRLRFPQLGVWRLPLMAHEFGHVVVSALEVPGPSGLTSTKPLEQFVELTPDLRLKLRELCSDVFAVYTLGPAFCCTALLLAFDPSSPDHEDAGASHPSDAKRAYVILDALRRLDDDKDRFNLPFHDHATRLEQLWEAARLSAGTGAGLDEAATGQLDIWLDTIWAVLRHKSAARYDRNAWARALRLSGALASAQPAAGGLQPGDSLADVLNGAWAARLSESPSKQLGATALEYARAVAS